MNRITKYEIKSDVRDILAEIDYEEYMFNKIFKTNVTFKKSYKKFNLIHKIYGSKAYRKFVPTSYKEQDLVELINTQDYLVLCDRHGKKVYKDFVYTVKLNNCRSRIGSFFYKAIHMFTRNKIKLHTQTPLLLPEAVPKLNQKKTNDGAISN